MPVAYCLVMKPAPFNLLRPSSVDEALALLQSHGDEAKVLAGGQSLVPLMNFRLAQPHNLIDLNGIEGLDQIKLDDQTLSLGAMVRQRDVERSPALAERLPILREAIEQVAHPAIRNRGTVGGSLVHADPSAELPLLAIALDSTFHLRSARASRSVAARDFYQGYLLDRHRAGRTVDCDRFSPAAGGFRLVLHRDRAPAWRFRHRRGGGAARLRARSKNRLRPRRTWRSRSGAAAHDRSGTGALGRAAWRRSFSPGVRSCGASGGSAGRHPRFFELPAPSHRRVGAPRLGNCGKSDQRAGVMTDMISITFKVNGSEQIGGACQTGIPCRWHDFLLPRGTVIGGVFTEDRRGLR